jgi:DNA-directed RNA polymerase alpha subunit
VNQPTDDELFSLAVETQLIGFIAIAAAVHPDKVDTKAVCAPANTAALAYGRAVLQKWCMPKQGNEPVEPEDDLRCLDLTANELHPLLREGFTRISQVRDTHRQDLLKIRTIGPQRADLIQNAIARHYASQNP